MTGEEAIQILRDWDGYFIGHSSDDVNEALNIAIQSLEQELCKDAISRYAVLSKIEEVCFSKEWAQFRIDYGSNGQRDFLINYIEQLSSVTLQPKMGHWIKTPKAVMGEGYMWYCDKCEHQVYQDNSKPCPSEKYCPNCGCHMVEPQKIEVK